MGVANLAVQDGYCNEISRLTQFNRCQFTTHRKQAPNYIFGTMRLFVRQVLPSEQPLAPSVTELA